MSNLHRLASNRFLVIGRAGMDLYPEPPGTSIDNAATFSSALGGSSANICAAIVRLGGAADLITCVSDDAVGRYCLRQLDAYRIGRRHVRVVGGEYRNSLALSESRIVDHQTVIYRNGAADFQMTRSDIEAADISAFAGLIATGTSLAAEPSRSATLYAFEQAARLGVPVIFDIDYRPYSWASADEASQVYSKAAALCDIIVGNDVEFGFMAGDYEQGLSRARELSENRVDIVVYKMGEKGAISFHGDEEITTGIFAVDALKPTGAGDSFLGGLVTSLAQQRPLREAVIRGSACASIVVGRIGCAPAMPTADELDAFLDANQKLKP